MKTKRFAALALVLVFLLGSVNIALAANDDPWYKQDFWETEQLLSLGAELPVYNAQTKQYEISKPEQLLFLTGIWKPDDTNGDGAPDAPCNGTYVLTADLDMAPLMQKIGTRLSKDSGEKKEGYMPPIATESDQAGKEATDTHCAFFGVFDGQGHSISNLNVERMNDKYAGLFGNIGHDYGEGFIRNVAVLNMTLRCKASAGLIAGALYGDADNCIATGTIVCNEKTVGGLAGKIKKNENGYVGIARNCFVYADITVLGMASENGAAGGITSAQSGGGAIENCYAGGSIRVEGVKAESVAGICGNLNGGEILTGSVMALKSILVESGTDIGLLSGNYSGANGGGVSNNYVWDGTLLTGNVSSEHPDDAAYKPAGAKDLLSKAFYKDTVGWDFDKNWGWVGEDALGIPLPKPFENLGQSILETISQDLVVKDVVLRSQEPMTNAGYAGEKITLTATLTLPDADKDKAAEVTLHYGADKDGSKFTKTAKMQAGGEGVYTADFPETGEGDWYYYYSATVGDKTVTFPSNTGIALRLSIIPASARKTAKYITISPGKTYDTIGFGWITEADGLDAVLQYRAAGSNADWTSVKVEDIQNADLGSRGSVTGYSVDISGLQPKTEYEYQVQMNDSEGDYTSLPGTFTTLPADNEFGFILISDLQTTIEDGYLPYLYTLEGFMTDPLSDYNFTINLGDLTEDCSPAQWRNMFKVLDKHYANSLTAFVPGNHENKGDALYQMFKAVTNSPGGMENEYIGGTTGSFKVGDVCFVMLNTEPLTGVTGADAQADKQDFYQKEKEWTKQQFEASGCKWRVIVAHAGLIQDDPWATEFIETMCDELDVDLYFNGHIHDYYRATVYQGAAAEVGEGTTFITTSPMGCKFDDFVEGEIDELIQFQTGGKSDARQYFTYVKAGDSGLEITAYQRSRDGEITNPKQFIEYDVIDSVSLTESLSVKRGNYKPSDGTPDVDAPAKPESSANYTWIWICAGAVALGVVITIVLTTNARKKKSNG